MHILGFDHPEGLHYSLTHDLWCQCRPDGSIRIGVTAFGVHLSGDFYMARPKPVATQLGRGQTLAIVELSKSIVSIKSPISGVVTAVNPGLEDRPEWIHRDPYGQGWLVEIRPSLWPQELAELHGGSALPEAAAARMRLEPGHWNEALRGVQP